ncbi:MAG: DUF6249 domain-containing protein [Bacteroidales bacterium]|nr:DUF6249 domain-containing protein [Bacteroidales bacterium]
MKKYFILLLLGAVGTLFSFDAYAKKNTPAKTDTAVIAASAATVDAENPEDERLTSEHLYRLKMKELEIKDQSVVEPLGLLVPISFFLSIFGILFIFFYYQHKDRRRRYSLLEKAIDKGQQIPDISLLTEKKQRKVQSVFDYVKNGIIFTLLGIAISLLKIFSGIHNDENSNGWFFTFIGFFFLAFGLAWLLIAVVKHLLDKKQNGKMISENEK